MDEPAKRILIVDDEKALARALELKLGFLKYDVTVANDGQTALDILKAQAFDLILLDAVMPQKNGFEVLEELGKLKITTPVIMLSNLSQSEDIEKAKALGAKDFFVKSDIPLSDIVEIVKKQV